MATITYNNEDWTYEEVTALDWKIWMDRNLWASQVATSKTDSAAYWDYFQWGRWDDGSQLYNSTTTTTKYSVNDPLTVENPSKFVTWTDWRSSRTDTLWASWINIPTWWRLPTKDEWVALCTAESITDTNSSTKAFNSTLKLTVAGLREFDIAGYDGCIGINWHYWASTPNTDNGYAMVVTPKNIYPALDYYRSFGFPIRLIKAAPTNIKSINWLAYSSIKSINWLTKASIKSFNWLT